MIYRSLLSALIALIGIGRAEQSAMRLANDMVRVNVSTAPIYGALEPERRAMVLAAKETMENGYDKFLIVDGASDYKPNVLGHTPGQAHGYINDQGGRIYATGPSTIAMPRFETAITVKMFKSGDPNGHNAIDAAEILKSS